MVQPPTREKGGGSENPLFFLAGVYRTAVVTGPWSDAKSLVGRQFGRSSHGVSMSNGDTLVKKKSRVVDTDTVKWLLIKGLYKNI